VGPRKPTIVAADNHTLYLDALKLLLQREFDVLSVVSTGDALLDAAATHRPDIILLEISLPILSGLDAAALLKTATPESRIVFLTAVGDSWYITEAIRRGARGYISKRSSAAELIEGLRTVLADGQFRSRSLLQPEPEVLLPVRVGVPPSASLTPRQREVLVLVAEGCCRKDIAVRLGISVKTVEFHKTRVAEILQLRGNAAFTRYAVEHGCISTISPASFAPAGLIAL